MEMYLRWKRFFALNRKQLNVVLVSLYWMCDVLDLSMCDVSSYVPTLRVAFSLIWLFAPERSSRKRWSRAMLEVLRRRVRGKLRMPRTFFFSCSLTWTTRAQIKPFKQRTEKVLYPLGISDWLNEIKFYPTFAALVFPLLNDKPGQWAAVFRYYARRRWSPPPTPGLWMHTQPVEREDSDDR